MNTIPPLTILSGKSNVASGAFGEARTTGQPATSQLAAGDIVRATVVAADSKMQFTLEMAGSRFQVASQVPLSVGQELELQVSVGKDGLQLRFVQDPLVQTLGRSLAAGSTNINANIFSFLQESPPEQLSQLDPVARNVLAQFRNSAENVLAAIDSGSKDIGGLLGKITGYQISPNSQANPQGLQLEITRMVQDFMKMLPSQEAVAQLQQQGVAAVPPERLQLYTALQQLLGNAPGASPAETKQVFQQLLQVLQVSENDFLSAERLPAALARMQEKLTDLATLAKGSLESVPSTAGDGFRTTAEKLRQLVESFGLRMEALLAGDKAADARQTLKAAMANVAQSQSSGSTVEQGQQVLRNIEFLQLAQVQLLRQDVFFFPLPLPFLDQGFVMVDNYREQTKKQENGEQPVNFSVYLKMQPLGNLQIDFLHGGDGLYIRFHGGSKAVTDYLASFGDELREAIPAPPIRQVSFVDGAEEPLAVLVRKSGLNQESLFSATI